MFTHSWKRKPLTQEYSEMGLFTHKGQWSIQGDIQKYSLTKAEGELNPGSFLEHCPGPKVLDCIPAVPRRTGIKWVASGEGVDGTQTLVVIYTLVKYNLWSVLVGWWQTHEKQNKYMKRNNHIWMAEKPWLDLCIFVRQVHLPQAYPRCFNFFFHESQQNKLHE